MFRSGNRKSPLNKLFEQFMKQIHWASVKKPNSGTTPFLTSTITIWKIAIQVEAYFCKRRVGKILKLVAI